MKLILSLLKKILVSLSDFYRKDYVNAELDKRVDSTVFTSSLGGETAERKRVDLEISASIDDNEANDEALAKVIEWQGYADQICRSVDDDVAIAFAEEFEKATVEYLADPTATKDWSRPSIEVNNNPYAESIPSVLVDFSKINAVGYQERYFKYPSFGSGGTVVAFLPNAESLKNAFDSHAINDIFLLVGEQTDVTYALGRVSSSVADTVEHRIYFYGKKTCKNLLMLPVRYCSFVSQYVTSIDSLCGGTGIYYTVGATEAIRLTLNTPNVVSARFALARYSTYSAGVFLVGGLPKCVDISGFACAASGGHQNYLKSIEFVGVEPSFPLAETADRAFEKRTVFDQFIAFPSLHTGNNMFLEAGMSAANISSVLDSLPSDPVGLGGTGIITFTGCPGASELTQESPSVAAAVAKGWTVEL